MTVARVWRVVVFAHCVKGIGFHHPPSYRPLGKAGCETVVQRGHWGVWFSRRLCAAALEGGWCHLYCRVRDVGKG